MSRTNRRLLTFISIALIAAAFGLLINETIAWVIITLLAGLSGIVQADWSYYSGKYKNRRLNGTKNFDYSQNDGFYLIGEGTLEFITNWSRGDEQSIHCYKDDAGIESIGVIRDAHEINKVRDAQKYLTGSRSVIAQKHDIVILRNVYGNYAALKIIDVKDATRNTSKKDEIIFEYLINPDGKTDFN